MVSFNPSESCVSATLTGSKARGLPGGRSATSPMLRVVCERTDFSRIGRPSSRCSSAIVCASLLER